MRVLRNIIVVLLTFSAMAGAQLKLGFVNSAKVLSEYPDAQEAQKKIDSKGKAWQAELERMSKDLQAKYEAFQQKEATLSDQAKKDQQQQLVALEQKGVQYRQEKFANDGELAQLTDSLLSPVKRKVMKTIEAVAKEKGVQFMFDRNDQILVLLYGDVKYDYTNLVIDRLKRGEEAK